MVIGQIHVVLLEQEFNEINLEDDLDQFVELQTFSSSAFDVEEFVDDVADFRFREMEDMGKNSFDFIGFEEEIFIVIVALENLLQLVHNHADESIHGRQTFQRI